MKNKTTMIIFIFLLLFLITAVSAADNENETLKSDINENIDVYSSIEYANDKLELQDDKNILSASAKTSNTVAVKKEKTILKASNVNMYYKDGKKYSVTLSDKNKKAISNAKIKIVLSSKTYTKTTDKKGNVILDLNLNPGTYSISTSFEGTSKYEKSTVKNKITVKSTIKCSDYKKIYKNNGKYSSTFYDKTGKLLKNTAVKFKLNSKTYSVKTDSKGAGKLSIDLKPGKYTITSINSKTGESLSKIITITPLIIENKDQAKYYKNNGEFKVKIINSNGKSVGSGKQVSFTVNGATYKKTTDKNGYAKINVDLKPGKYTIKTTYDGCSVSNQITIKSLIDTNDLTFDEDKTGQFNVKILTSQGKASPNQKVTINVNGKTYTKTTDSKGTANLKLELEPGKYTITTKFGSLKSTNKITVNKIIKHSEFTHSIIIPSYVNVTNPYVFHNSAYALKTGLNGIIKLPKQELLTIQIGSKTYLFSTNKLSGIDSTVIGYKSHLIPFDGSSVQSEINKNNLKGSGIILSSGSNFIQIDYQSSSNENTEFFGFYADKGLGDSETITYIQNEKVMAKVNFQTIGYDETGLRYNLAKFYGKSIYDFNTKNYDQVTNYNTESIKYANTNEPVSLSYFGNYIVGTPSKEDIVTKFKINGKEELEKTESISYGLAENYRNTLGFEVLQSYSIINEKISAKIIDYWLSKSSSFISKNGVMNVYGMFLTSLKTAWMADELANSHAKELNIEWKRGQTTTILGGMNLNDTYIHILNADMGMNVKGANTTNIALFKLINSVSLPELEEAALKPMNDSFEDDVTNSIVNMLNSPKSYDIAFKNDMIYIQPSNSDSTIIINKTSGVANTLIKHDNFYYKGAYVKTTSDCCLCSLLPKNIVSSLKSVTYRYIICNPLTEKYVYPMTKLLYNGLKTAISYKAITLTGVEAVSYGLISTMLLIQDGGTIIRDNTDKKQWHSLMDTVTFTRPGYFQGKKVYNIPNKNGGNDYIEVPVKSDLTLDRDNAQYISNGNVKKLTKSETYKYFEDEKWTPISVPSKYWDESWK